jgi:hypothetical protein
MRTSRSRLFAPVLALALGLLAGSCGDESSPYDELDWSCTLGGTSCVCAGRSEADEAAPPAGSTASCPHELDCCFVKSESDGSTGCRCVALPEPAGEGGAGGAGGDGGGGGEAGAESAELRCHAEALDHGSTEVVPRCPPVTLDSAGVCALVYESCDPEYLESIGVIDCCEGTHCGRDSLGVLICLPD